MFDSPRERHQGRKKSPLTWWLVLTTIFVVAGLAYYVTFGPNPPIRVGKATTHITTPLDADGFPDYAAVLLAELREGVTREDNAAIPLLEALWPIGDDVYEPADAQLLLAELGMPRPPAAELRIKNYWGPAVRLAADEYYQQRVAVPNPIGDMREFAMERPWTADDLPFAAQWMKDNRIGLDRLRRAAAKPSCYFPEPELVRGGSGRCPSSSFQALGLYRRAAHYLNMLAYRSQGEGQYDRAASDAIAILQVARHAERGLFLIDRLAATGVARIGLRAIQQLADDVATPPATLRRLLKQLGNLPPVTLIDSRMLIGERYFALDAVIASSRDGVHVFEFMEAATDHVATLASRTSVDWNQPLTAINAHHDQLSAALKQSSRKGRDDALRALADKVQSAEAATAAVWDHPSRLVTPQRRGAVVADAFVGSFAFGYDLMVAIEERDRTQRTLTRLAIALAIYRAEQGEYPATLEALTPEILGAAPTDLFHDQPFVYRRTDDGHLVYSCGPNGVDEGGSNEGSAGVGLGSATFEGVELDSLFDESSNQLTADEQAAYDQIEQIPGGADDLSLRLPLPVEPWPWESP